MKDSASILDDGYLLRLQTVQNVVCKRISTSDAAKMLKITTRHMRRLIRKYKLSGPDSLRSQRIGKESNNRIPDTTKNRVLSIIRRDYYDYGPTLASEKLEEYNGIVYSKETIRQWMIEDGLWHPNIKHEPVIHPPRARRACFGELVQIDGSDHDWFEDRAPRCTLLVFIDDATSMILQLMFVECESSINYFKALKQYFLNYGKPLNFYSDKHVVFRVNHPNATSGAGQTQYTRALNQLDIEPIYAHSPQAKGRVERANETLQDRLVKELRYYGIDNIEDANAHLKGFADAYNLRFAKPPRSDLNVHVPLTEKERENLDIICSVQTPRVISKDLMVRHNKAILQINTPGQVRGLAGAKVLVCEDTLGKVSILYNNKSLPFEVYNKTFKDGHILSDKELNHFLNAKAHEWQQSLRNQQPKDKPNKKRHLHLVT